MQVGDYVASHRITAISEDGVTVIGLRDNDTFYINKDCFEQLSEDCCKLTEEGAYAISGSGSGLGSGKRPQNPEGSGGNKEELGQNEPGEDSSGKADDGGEGSTE